MPRHRELALQRRLSGEAMPPIQGLDPGLNALVLKACAYDPRQRFESPTDMREALEAAASRQGASSQPETRRETPYNGISHGSTGTMTTKTSHTLPRKDNNSHSINIESKNNRNRKRNRFIVTICSLTALVLVLTATFLLISPVPVGYGPAARTDPERNTPDNGDSMLVFEDTFSGSSVDMSKWGVQGSGPNKSLSISDGRMTMQGGYAYINRDPMVNQILEFDFIKKNQEYINSWVMLQFRTNLNSNAHSYEFAILFRPNGGIRYVFPGTEAGLSNQITKVDEPPFNVRVEVEDGYVTVLTKTSPEEEYVRQGDPIYVEALNGTAVYTGFFHMYVTGYIGNVKLYRQSQGEGGDAPSS
ncbi:MAG: hypothetical protein FWF88_12995, partial [Peptococcaceae bacterium]|nr:hypothetical protein [Peptococcaceae bacterium]